MGGTTFISDGMCLYNHSHCLFKRMQRCQKTTFAKGVSSQFLFALAIAHFNPLLLFVVARLFFSKANSVSLLLCTSQSSHECVEMER